MSAKKTCPDVGYYACPMYPDYIKISKCEDLGVCQRTEQAACEVGPHRAGGRNRIPVVTMMTLRHYAALAAGRTYAK